MKNILVFSVATLFVISACNNNENNAVKHEQEGGCPFGFDKDHKKEQISRFKTNKEWWPNRLNLSILSQNSALTNPMSEGFNYQEEFERLDYAQLKKDIEVFLPTRKNGGLLIMEIMDH